LHVAPALKLLVIAHAEFEVFIFIRSEAITKRGYIEALIEREETAHTVFDPVTGGCRLARAS
jgi:hypothetical protein